MKIILLGLGVILNLSSCQDNKINEQVEFGGEGAHSCLLYRQPQSVEEMLSQMENATRSPRRIGSIEYVASSSTRVQSADTLLNLINFSYDEGFVLISNWNPSDIYALSP